MADITVYDSDPGLIELLARGAQFNVILEQAVAARLATGAGVLGLVGAVVNDRGAPNVPVVLSRGVDDIRSRYGGFKSWLGSEADGFAGNLYARALSLDAPTVVLQPVDLAIKTATIATGTDLLAKLTRSVATNGARTVRAGSRLQAPALTGSGTAADTGVVTSVEHELVVGRAIEFTTLTGGAGLSLATTYYVLTAPTDDTFTVSLTPGGTAVTIGTSYSAVAWESVAYVIATLEDVSWTEAETGTKSVRVRQVSGTPATLVAVTGIVDAFSDVNITVATTETAVPDDVDATELALRYEEAFTRCLDNPAGQSINVIVTDRDEAGIADDLATHCVTASGRGFFRIGVIAPPNGTSSTLAEGDSGNGIGRSTLDQSRVVYTHPSIVRGWRLTDTETVTMPAAMVLAARIANTRPEQNPARPHPIVTGYRPVAVEALADPWASGKDAFQAGVVLTQFERDGNGFLRSSWRDGIMANGAKIADRRLEDYLVTLAISALAPYHKGPARPSDREAADLSLRGAYQSLVDAQRIAAFVTSLDFDADNDHLTVHAAVDKTGNMDVITFSLALGGDVVAGASGGEA